MAKFAGIEFAPLNIPFERRLQTAGVLQWTLSFLFLGFGSLGLMVYLLSTKYYWVTLGYLLWYFWDYKTPERGGRRVSWFREWTVWKYMRDYFPISLVKTHDLDPKKNYLLGVHPHGVMCTGAFCSFATDAPGWHEKFPGLKPCLVTLAGQFKFPLFREYFMTTGSISCSKESIRWMLTQNGVGNALVLIPGGAPEALEAHPNSFRLNLKNKKGFIKLALESGTHLVPVFSFGENDIYEQVANPKGSFIRKVQDQLTTYFGFSLPFFRGRGVFNYTLGILPYRRPIRIVVGTPIDVVKSSFPSKEEVESLHTKYVSALVNLFETHKVQYGINQDQHLDIF